MASFYDSASIITIPSGYKAGTLYSQIPTDGAGDMAFSRTGDTATRVNSAGIIERCITNAIVQSESFDNASWNKPRTNVSANATTAPNGTNTADKLIATSVNGSHYANSATISLGSGGIFSLYVKASEFTKIAIRENTTSGAFASFDLSGVTLISSGSGAYNSTITSVGNGWFRIQMAYTTGSNVSIGIYILDNSYVSGNPDSYSYIGDNTSGLFVWGAQLQLGDFVTNYIPTTTAAVTTGPVTNLPRLDYFGSTCPQLLMEPTRTNLILYSQMFGNSVYTKIRSSVVENTIISPDGYMNADKLVENTDNNNHSLGRIIGDPMSASGAYRFSVFAKAGERSNMIIRLSENPVVGTNNYFVNFNLSTGQIVSTLGESSVVSPVSSMQSYGNGWYRCTIGITLNTAVRMDASIFTWVNNTIASNPVYLGNGTSGLYIWGAQVEAGAYATSYIPTFGATVTRNADYCSKTSATSLIGQTEGTLFIHFKYNANQDGYFGINDGTASNRIILGTQNANKNIRLLIDTLGASQTAISSSSNILVPGNTYKMAVAYNNNDIALYLNGSLIATDSTASIPSTTRFEYSALTTNIVFSELVLQTLVFKTRLSNTDLATLTTL